jgi:folate-dependent phosphoribosylglycinamide formyltransferase PurN
VPTGDSRNSEFKSIEVGGKIQRVAIITVRRNPWAYYLARRLRPTGVEIFLFSQTRFRVERNSIKYFARLLRNRGLLVCVDAFLLYVAALTVRLLQTGWRRISWSSRPSKARSRNQTNSEETWLQTVDVPNINDARARNLLREAEPDLILLAGAPILSGHTIDIARVACLNPHGGITPRYAGYHAFHWAIYENRFQDVGFTIHLVVPQVDSGPIIYQERIDWDISRVIASIWPVLRQRMYVKLADIAADIIDGKRFCALPQIDVRVRPPAGLFVHAIAELKRIRHAVATRGWRSIL